MLNFLNEIKNDELLNDNYRRKFYRKIEEFILQDYFRICNYLDYPGKRYYDLDVFKTKTYNRSMFCKINQFYIDNDAFQIHDIEFYEKTL